MDLYTFLPVESLTQGDDFLFYVSIPNYPSSLYTLTYTFKNTTTVPFTITSTKEVDGYTHKLFKSHTETASIVPDTYFVQISLINDEEATKQTLGMVKLVINQNFSTMIANSDPRSKNQKILDQIKVLMSSPKILDGMAEVTIDTRTYKKMTYRELVYLEGVYQRKVNIENGISEFKVYNLF